MLKRTIFSLSILVMVIGLAVTAQAALVDMHDGTIYDTDTELSWLKDCGTSGLRTWANAKSWAAGLNINGLTGWRLPEADVPCDSAGNCTTSEIGHLYFTEMGNDPNGQFSPGPFVNWPSEWWSGTQGTRPGTGALYKKSIHEVNGVELSGDEMEYQEAPAMPVLLLHRSVPAAVPASGTWGLICLGLAGLIIVGIRLRRATR